MIAQKNILLSMGTRPEIIKMLPIYFKLKERGLRPILMHTGQHSDMADSLYDLFGVTPDVRIDLDRNEISPQDCALSSLGSLLLKNISQAMKQLDPSMVLVHGDTSSALMAALAAFYQQRPVAHIEAGLRSYNEYNPFPEEKNRTLIAKLAHWHFAPTARARENLLADGVDDRSIYVVGNTIVEAAHMGAAKMDSDHTYAHFLQNIAKCAADRKMILVTVHRRENQEYHITQIAQAVVELAEKHADMMVLWPVHPNPVVKNAVYAELQKAVPSVASRLHVTPPLDYPVLLWALKNAWITLTDSGGIQEEAVALHTPVLVLRETTERPEVIEAGAGILVGTNKANLIMQVEKLYHQPLLHQKMCLAGNPFGDGTTAHRICTILTHETPEKNYAYAV